MSLEFENQQGEITTKPLFSSTEIKVVRFIIGAITVEISTNDNPNGSKTLDVNLRQNLVSTTLAPPDCTVNQTNVENTTNQSVLNRPFQPNGEEVVEITEGPELQTGRDAVVQIMDGSGGTNENGNPIESEERETKEKSEEEKRDEEYVKSMHGWLLTTATLFMSLAFTAELNLAKMSQNELFMKDKYSAFTAGSSGAFDISMLAIVILLFNPSFTPLSMLISVRQWLLYAICQIWVMHCAMMSYSEFYSTIPFILLICLAGRRTYRVLHRVPENRL